MARTVTFTDKQADALLSLVRKEALATYTLQREKVAAEELYMVLTTTPHVPEDEQASAC